MEGILAPGVIGLARKSTSAVPSLKRSRWTQFKAAVGRRFGWIWQPRLYATIALGFLLGRALAGSNLAPFGIAFYAAVRGARFSASDAAPAALAALVGAFTAIPDRIAWVGLSILVCHLLAPLLRLGRSGHSPLGAGVVAALAVATPAVMLRAPLAGNRADWLMVTFWVGFTGVAALVFTLGMADLTSGRLRFVVPGESAVPVIILLAAAVCGLYGLPPAWGGISLLDVAAGLMVLASAYAGGPPVGAAAGAVLAITLLFPAFRGGTISVSAETVSHSMAYVVAGMLAGAFRELKRVGTGLAFGLGLITYFMVTLNDPDQLAVLAFSAAAAVGLFWLIPSAWLHALPSTLATPQRGTHIQEKSAAPEPAAVTERLAGISRVFKEISRTLEQVAAVETPAREEHAPSFEVVTQRVCSVCSMYHHCWDRQREATERVFTEVWAKAEQEGSLSPHAPPDGLEEICIKPDQVVAEVNYLLETHRTHAQFERKLEEGRTVVVDYLKNLSRMMDRFVDEAGKPAEQVRPESTPVLRAFSGVARLPKRGGHISGDSYAGEPLGPDRYLMALSDGMGVGRVAAAESKQCVALLREILKAGFATDVAVKTVNSALLLHSPDEMFATVDLALLDLITGRAEFVKVGAAPSFIKRGGDVTVVKTASVPVGIINQVQVEPEFRTLYPDDLIVMITDGVWDASKDEGDKERWILEHLRREASADPEEVAESLLARALDLMPDSGDDLTVLVARIESADGTRPVPEPRATGQWVPLKRAPRHQSRSGDGKKR